MSRPIITVDGIDGSGKSTFARQLLPRLEAAGRRPVLARVDDFRLPLDWTSGNEAELYYTRYFDLVALARLIRGYVAGTRELSLPSFDGIAGTPGVARHVVLGERPVLVIEGVFIRRIPVGPLAALHLYLDTPPTLARDRLIRRDTGRGREREEVERRLDRRYDPGQRRYHQECSPRDRAGVLIDNSDHAHPRLRRSTASAEASPLWRAIAGLVPHPAFSTLRPSD
jgi:uridine kinase